jgi:hypothetical protein
MTRAMRHAVTPFAIEVPHMAALTSAATLLAHSSYLANLDGQVDRGIEATTAGLRFASHFEDLPFLLGLLVRVVIVERTLAPLEHAPLRDASDASLASVDRALRESSVGPSVPFATEAELRGLLFAFHLVRTGRAVEVAAEMGSTPQPRPPLLWAVYGRGPLRWWGNWDEILQINLMADSLDATRRPPYEALPDLRRIDREVERLTSMAHPMLVMFPSVRSTVERVARADGGLARARIRVALERYRRETGGLPAALQDLVPKWLESVPIHALSGSPFGYTRSSNGYELKDPAIAAK